MTGKRSVSKGLRGEKLAKKLLESWGCRVIRGKEKKEQDLIIDGFGRIEVKYGMSVPKKIYKFLEQDKNNLAVMCKRCGKKERKQWLLIFPFDIGIMLLNE